MKGIIQTLELNYSSGIILSNEGKQLSFSLKDWKATNVNPVIGLEVDFIIVNNKPSEIYSIGDIKTKNRITFIKLSFIGGFIGLNNFYAGYKTIGIIKIVLLFISIYLIAFGRSYLYPELILLIYPFLYLWSICEACLIKKDVNGLKFNKINNIKEIIMN